MQTFTQTDAGATTHEFNVPGNYFVLLACTNVMNVRFYKAGRQLDLATITGLLAGVEATLGVWDPKAPNFAFDKVAVDTTAADTFTIGIGNGQVRYNRSQGSASITSITNQTSGDTNTNKTATNASAQLIAANAARRYLLVQNKDATGRIWLNFGAGAATQANGIKLEPGETYEREFAVPTQAIQAIGDAASNANIVVVEG